MLKKNLGFIGIGLMGQPMTLRLLAAGYTVRVWNRSPEKIKTVLAAGALASDSITNLVQQSDVILLCLSDTAVVEQIVREQIIPAASAGKLIIDLSSIDPDVTRALAATLKCAGVDWVDSPVSGGTAGAEQGTLAIMAGGETQAIAVAEQILQPLYGRFTHMGPVGSGQMTKICNQMIVGCNLLVLAEMMALAKAAGVDAGKIPQALSGGFADSKPLQITGAEMAAEQYEPVKWKVRTLLKDLNMANSQALANNQSVPMSALAAQLMHDHGSQGYLDQDPATLIKLYTQT